MRILCALGEHLHGDTNRGIGVEYAAFIPAIRRIGHEVFHFETYDRRRYDTFASLNRSLMSEVERLRPDVLLVVQMNYEIWTETLSYIRARGDVATVCWTTDDSWKYRECSRFLAKHYDIMTTTYPDVVSRYRRDGAPNVLLTQWAANSEWLMEPQPAAKCRHAVTFVGAAHGDRVKRIEALEKIGVKVACFGHGWPSGPLAAADVPQVMRDSIITLGFANVPPLKPGPLQVKVRTYEAPGSGAFLLAEYAPGMERAYRENSEMVFFRSGHELVERIRYYLAHPDERDAIARAAHERTRREHTYERRMKELIDAATNALTSRRGREGLTAPCIEDAVERHAVTWPLKVLKRALVATGTACFGPRRGPRAARRLVFEMSWRLAGAHTFSCRGWPGRMFPEDNG